MSNLRKKLKITRDEKGQTLIFVLVAMILGALVIGPLLAYVSTSLALAVRTEDNAEAYYAADAGVAWAIANLLQPREAEDPEDYCTISAPPPVNGYTANVTIAVASGAHPPLLDRYLYLNPYDTDHGAIFPDGTDPYALAPNKYWLFQVYVPQSEDISIHWVFSSASPSDNYWCCLFLFEEKQVCPPGSPECWLLWVPVASDCEFGTGSPPDLNLTHSVTSPGWYTVVFYNSLLSEVTVNSARPSSTGGEAYIWVQVGGYQDYIITSTAGDTTVTAYVRQTPGPSTYWLSQQISVFSWQID